ncbi:MAG: peptidoglycan DD-metalloendopeptidase family protein [Minisyncoccia bacterium]
MKKRGSILIIILFLIVASIFYLFIKGSYKKIEFYNKGKLVNFEEKTPKVNEKRVFEINLSENRIDFYEDGRLKYSFKIKYQSPEGVWYQTPTGYFRVGVKKEKHLSSLFPVYFDNAVQFYEDFFIHGVPYYEDGKKVSSQFTGGCLRLEDDDAKKFYDLAKKDDLIIIFKTLDNIKINPNFSFPVNKNEYWIRQRFNSPLRNRYTGNKNRKVDYIQHAGIDLAPNQDAKDYNVYSIYDGKIVKIVKNGNDDHGLGNVLIIEHNIKDEKINTFYSLYGHLEKIREDLKEGDFVKKGEIIGEIGATGYGCNYWRIGEDGCDKLSKLDKHLHFEIKTMPKLESPIDAKCFINNSYKPCYGYVPDNPEKFGYLDPIKFLSK